MFLKNETRQNKNTKEKKEFPSAGVEPQTFTEKRNISFQNDISLKTMRLGVLSWKKLKNRETHGRIVSLDQLGSRRAIAHLFVTFIAWRVKKLQNFVNVGPKVGTLHAQQFLIAERERSIYDSYRFDIGRFRAEPTNHQRCLHPSEHLHIAVTTITCSSPYA